MIGGDFNSCLGGVQPGDSVDSLGCWGFGARNAPGVQLANWILQNGLQILSRQSDNQDTSESWTCERYFDEARVQLDYIIADERAVLSRVWNMEWQHVAHWIGPSMCTLLVDMESAKK